MRLLIVDDEQIIRTGLVRLSWSSIGIDSVFEAENSAAALQVLRQNAVNIILCDIQMPGMGGLEFVKMVHEEYPRILVILLTGYGVFSYAQEAIKYGVFDYLVKPSSPETILASVSRGIQKLTEDDRDGEKDNDHILPFLWEHLNGKVAKEILEYLEQNYMHELNLSVLAEYMNYSPQYLSRLIKKEMSYNFVTLLSMIRLTKAAELIAKSDEKVYMICDAVGIQDHRYFSQLFKSAFGESPLNFRRNNCGKTDKELRTLIQESVKRMDEKE